jgi:hypothetical protein
MMGDPNFDKDDSLHAKMCDVVAYSCCVEMTEDDFNK